MKDFIQLIQQEDVTLMQLIKGSMKTIKGDKKDYRYETFKYIAFSLTVAFLMFFLMMMLMAVTGSVAVTMILSFFIGMTAYTFFLGAITSVYQAVIGVPKKKVDDFVKKACTLYVFAYIASLIIGAVYGYMLGNSNAMEMQGGMILLNFVISIIVSLLMVTFAIIAVAIEFEYMLTEEGLIESAKKVFSVFGEYKNDLFKKALGVLLISTAFVVIFYLIIFAFILLIASSASSSFNAEALLSGAVGSIFSPGVVLMVILLFVVVFAISIYVGWVYITIMAGYYFNLRYHEGNGIIGLTEETEDETHNIQKVEEVTREFEVVKVEDEQEQEVVKVENEEENEVVEATTEAEVVEVVEETTEAVENETTETEVVTEAVENETAEAEVVEEIKEEKQNEQI